MCACIAQLQGEQLVILREFVLIDADTRMLAQAVRNAYPRQEIICFPDPTGSRSQTSSMGLSDHAILRQHGFKVKSPKAPWAIRKVRSSTDVYSCPQPPPPKVDPSAASLISGITGIRTREIRCRPQIVTAMSDALGYMCLGIAKGLLLLLGQAASRCNDTCCGGLCREIASNH